MTGEELGPAGPPGPKVVRLLYFVGAGFLCTAVINKWRDFQRKSIQQQQHHHQIDPLSEKATNAVHKAVE
ncbi:Protein split ends like [Actinidia chinensis var. chinensis]|uniref:Protein split ends like n=1 Tax=Actinidia chinensis var. chinensis TaxID=1590841 RepID=A0A2R6QCN1_ACTCC|nr:Protein split ends like [Actinidia chinensis var. chinensis]